MSTAATRPPDLESLLQRLHDYEQLAAASCGAAVHAPPGAGSMRARLRIAGEELAVPLSRIRSVIRGPAIVEVPGTPDWLRGALRLGQQMIAVVSGEWVAGMPRAAPRRGVELAAVLDLGSISAAVLVDAVDGLDRSGATPHADGPPARELDLNDLRTRLVAPGAAGSRRTGVAHARGEQS